MQRRIVRSGAVLVVLVATGLAGATSATAAGSPDPDGRYRGNLVADNAVDGGPVFFDVASDGKRIKRWRVTMNVTCASYPVRVDLITQTMPTMKVAANGRFRSVFTGPVKGVEARIEVSGRLKGRKVTQGKIDYDVKFTTGTCTRKADWTAKPRS